MRYSRSGFTIVELLIVIVVIAILAAISVAAYSGISERARVNSAYSFAQHLERTYAETKFFQMTFENGVGAGTTSPTEEIGGISVYDKDTNITNITSVGVPGSTRTLDYSTTSGQAIIRSSGKPFPAGGFVFSYWVKSGTLVNDDGQFFACFDCGTSNQFGWNAVSHGSTYRFRYTPYQGAAEVVLDSTSYERSKWNHVAVVFDPEKQLIRLYLNGTKQDEKATLAPVYTTSYYFDWGRADNMGFRGQFDDIKIYNY